MGLTTGTNKTPSADQWAILAALRFFLAVIVTCYHETYISRHSMVVNAIASLGGKAAVMGFFVISGFSIAASIGRSPNKFYERRLIRIAPLYWFALLFSLVPFMLFGFEIEIGNMTIEAPDPFQLLQNAVFLQGLSTVRIESNLSLWSLGPEVLYYSLAPFLNRASTKILIALMLISFVSYFINGGAGAMTTDIFGISAIHLAWAWLTGFIAYRVRGNHAFLTFALVAGLAALENYNELVPSSLPVYAFVICTVVIPAIRIHTTLRPVLNYLGELSYPIYVLSFPVTLICFKYSASAIATMLICLGSSILAYHLIDIPARTYFTKRLNGLPILIVANDAAIKAN